MKQASREYREEMKFPFRNRWLVKAYIGFVREKYQANASLSAIDVVSPLSPRYNESLFDDVIITDRVATFENNLVKADGSYMFTDETYSNLSIGYYGFISEALSDENQNIDFSFKFTSNTSEKGLGGLTMYFDETYPTEFSVTVKGNGGTLFTKTYTNDASMFKTTDVFGDSADEMIIHVIKMNRSNVRFRLRYVLFGVGVQFTNQDFLSTNGSLSSFMHPCSVELPTCDLSFSIDNYDDKFNFDKAGSVINLADVGQDVIFQVQYEREDGVIESIDPTVLELSSFDADSSSINIQAVDFLRNENDTIVFDDPSFFTSETTLYDVAMKVKESLSNTVFEVVLDDGLKDIPMKFNYIQTTTKQALMMIASAGRCVMDLRGKGLYIRRVDYDKKDVTAISDNKTSYSDMDVVSPNEAAFMSTFEKDRPKADGVYKFAEDQSSLRTGYVSNSLSDENGNFTDIPYIELNLSEAISPEFFTLTANNIIKHMKITTFYDDEQRETFEYEAVDSNMFDTLHDFLSFNKMRVEFFSIQEPYNRMYVSYVSFDKNVYDVARNMYLNTLPKATLEEVVKNIIVYYTTSSEDGEGNFQETKKSITIACNVKGTNLEYDNAFITTEEVARSVGEWLRDYYTTRISYEFDFVGDPTLEVNDIVRIENDYNSNIICDVEQNELSFANGGISGKMVVKRREDDVVRSQNKLAAR